MTIFFSFALSNIVENFLKSLKKNRNFQRFQDTLKNSELKSVEIPNFKKYERLKIYIKNFKKQTFPKIQKKIKIFQKTHSRIPKIFKNSRISDNFKNF